MVKTRVDGKDQLTIRIETDAAPAGLGDAIGLALVSARPTLRDSIQKGTVLPIRVDLVPTGTLERNPRTGKLMRVKDAL